MRMKSSPHLLRTLSVADGMRERSDTDLLQRFIADRDEDAFVELVRRHGPMVMAAARRVTRHPQDAEDAFQAAFLVLARRAGQVRQPEQLGNWLYGVAYRTALEARAARRRVLEQSVSALPDPAAKPPPDDDLRQAIDDEIAKLPEKYRAAVILCELEALPRAEAAKRLKIPDGTLSSRLAQARKLLAARLGRRGITTSAGAIASVLAADAGGLAIARDLIRRTAVAAARVASGGPLNPNLVSPSVHHLTEGAIRIMLATRLRHAALTAVLACGLLGLGAYGVAQVVPPPPTTTAPRVATPPTSEAPAAAPGAPGNKAIAKGIEDEDVPYSGFPAQAAVRVDGGKLLIRERVDVNTPAVVKKQGGADYYYSSQLRSQVVSRHDVDVADVIVFDMKGNRLPTKVWKEKLKTDQHVLISHQGKLPNPRELALFKDDVLLLVLPTSVAPPMAAPAMAYVPQTSYVPAPLGAVPSYVPPPRPLTTPPPPPPPAPYGVPQTSIGPPAAPYYDVPGTTVTAPVEAIPQPTSEVENPTLEPIPSPQPQRQTPPPAPGTSSRVTLPPQSAPTVEFPATSPAQSTPAVLPRTQRPLPPSQNSLTPAGPQSIQPTPQNTLAPTGPQPVQPPATRDALLPTSPQPILPSQPSPVTSPPAVSQPIQQQPRVPSTVASPANPTAPLVLPMATPPAAATVPVTPTAPSANPDPGPRPAVKPPSAAPVLPDQPAPKPAPPAHLSRNPGPGPDDNAAVRCEAC